MGRLERLELENFKSYAGSHTIGPFKDFTAVIGPNGAGKSNLMDAISFVLGVQSRHLRSQKLDDLVFRAEGDTVARRKASVKVVYKVGHDEVDDLEEGDEIHFSRTVTSSGSSTYRIDGKEVAWKVYEAKLKAIGVLVKARNFLVFQGDVESIASRNPKELTELFEQISGSDALQKDYEAKKAAMEAAEDAAVFSSQRKKACQLERRVVKEQKEEAERYEAKVAELEALRREFFLVQLFHIDKDVKESESNLSAIKTEEDGLQEKEQEAERQLKAKKKELAALTRALSNAEDAADADSSKLADLTPKGAKLEKELKVLEKQLEEVQKQAADLKEDQEKQASVVESLEADIEKAVAQEKEAEAAAQASQEEEQLDSARAEEYATLKAEARNQTQAKRATLEQQKRALAAARSRLDEAASEETSVKRRMAVNEKSRHDYEERRTLMEHTIRSTSEDHRKLAEEIANLEAENRKEKARAKEVEDELAEIDEQLRDAKAGRQENKHEARMTECLKTMMRLYPGGVRGRLSELCKPTHAKYNLAVQTAAGKHMDAIVVDTKQTGFNCIQYLRAHCVGTASFIPLDSVRPSPVNERLRTLGNKYRLCVDVLQVDAYLKPAIEFAFGTAVVADTLDDARDLCFNKGERVKCVTLDGALIAKGGNMTGGQPSGGPSGGTRWDAQEVERLKKERDELRTEQSSLMKNHRFEAHRRELQTKLQGLANRKKHAEADLQLSADKLREIQRILDADKNALTEAVKQREKAEAAVAKLQTTVDTLTDEMNEVEDEVFRDFCASVGVASIRDFEDGTLKAVQANMQKRMKLKEQVEKLRAQLQYEEGRDFKTPLEKILKKGKAKKKAVADARQREKEFAKEKEALLRKVEASDKRIAEAKEAAAAKEKEVRETQVVFVRRRKERTAIGKKSAAEEADLERLRARLHDVLQRAQIEEVDLPMRGREQDSESDDEESSGSNSGVSSTQDSRNQPHWSQSGDKVVARDRKVAHRVDLAQLKRSLRNLGPHELDETLTKQKAQLAVLKAEVERMQPNLKALGQFQSAQEKLRESGQSFEEAKQKSKEAAEAYEEVRTRRAEAFMEAFNYVSKALGNLYKELTRSSKHPLGGSASLSLDDQEEPYLGGIKFTAMPPMKRLRDMDQLSGGERTVAALALLFAIHSFRPAPFFVMDEIDAALDNINVKKVCLFIEKQAKSEGKGGFQSIVISLKDMFYEKADALVGICRDAPTNSSRTLTLDLEQYD